MVVTLKKSRILCDFRCTDVLIVRQYLISNRGNYHFFANSDMIHENLKVVKRSSKIIRSSLGIL